MKITTEVIEKYCETLQSDLIKALTEGASYTEAEQEYLVLANKIFSNLYSASILAARGAWGDSRILIRSAFETFIMLKLFQHEPGQLQDWLEECEITAFRNAFILHKHCPTQLPEDELMLCYQALSPSIQAQIPLSSTPGSSVVQFNQVAMERQLQKWKSKFMNIRGMIETIITHDPQFEAYQRFRFNLYDENSQIAHGDFNRSLKFYVDFDNQDAKEHLLEFYRQYSLLLVETIRALAVILNKDFDSALTQFYKNLQTLPGKQ